MHASALASSAAFFEGAIGEAARQPAPRECVTPTLSGDREAVRRPTHCTEITAQKESAEGRRGVVEALG